MEQRRCIFHYPNPIDVSACVGSAVRPLNMMRALQDSGYIVDEVTGYGQERKKKINKIKENIKKGIKYDFIYSESLTMPTLLSEKNHIPTFPFLDFSFFRFCKKNGVKIGLFYRDIFWRFSLYREAVSKWVSYVTIPFFKHDLRKYNSLLDVVYVPSAQFAEYAKLTAKWVPLPSGGEDRTEISDYMAETAESRLSLFYVGGIVALNDITELVKTVSDIENVKLTVCCPKDAYDSNKELFDSISGSNIEFVHERGAGLEKYYKKADAACLYFPNNDYRDMAMPVKLFEYIGYGKPVISSSKTAAAEYIEEHGIGWTANYGSGQLKELLQRLAADKTEVKVKAAKTAAIAPANTWDARAAQVIADLT